MSAFRIVRPVPLPALCSWILLVVILGVAGLVNPAQARRGPTVDMQGYRQMFYAGGQPAGRAVAAPEFVTWSQQVILDDDEEIQRHIRFSLEAAPGQALPSEVPVAVIDAAQGDICEPGGAEESSLGVRVEPMQHGFNHLGRPALCIAVAANAGAGAKLLEGHVVVRRPRVARMEDRFVLWLPVQPLFARARELHFEAVLSLSAPIDLATSRWSVDLARKPLPDNRVRLSFDLERVTPLPVGEGVEGIAGRVPAVLVSPRASWDDIALEHRGWWDATARLEGPVIPLAARVLSQPDAVASVREAASIVLEEIRLDVTGGRGGSWQLPRRAVRTVEAGEGTAASRAALLVALLRASDIRANVVLLSRSGQRVSPTGPVVFLNQVLVLVQGVSLRGDGQPLFIDTSRGLAWLGALDESLLGRDAFMLSSEGARWLRISGDPPRRHWTLNVRENPDARFEVNVEALLEGAPAARIRQWQSDGGDESLLPAGDLAWLGGAWRGLLALETADVAGGRLEVKAWGTLDREHALSGHYLAPPQLPQVAAPSIFRSTWPYSRDANLFDISLLESWTFASRRSGGAMPEGTRVTPFWEVDALGRWSGPLFKRRSRIRFTGRVLARDAAVEVERFEDFTSAALGGVRAP